MIRIGAVLVLLASLAGAAWAQQPAAPRRAVETVSALQSLLTLREAELQDARTDAAAERAAYEARLDTAMEWLKTAQQTAQQQCPPGGCTAGPVEPKK